MKKLNIMMIIGFLMIVLIACGSTDNYNQNNEEHSTNTNNKAVENDDSGNGGNNNSPDDGASNNENTNSGSSGKFGDGKVLSLGETGTVESRTGDYEITFGSFELLDEMGGEKPLDSDGVFVLMNATVKVTGEDTIEGEDLYSARLFNDEGTSTENTIYFNEFIDPLEGTLDPDDFEEGQFLFEISKGNSYELIINFGLDGVATEITWKFDADEASN